MARCRMIKPVFWDDEKLAKISRDSRLVYVALWNFSDDFGVVKGNPAWLKTHIFPYDEELTLKEFKGWLKELIELERVKPFQHNGEQFFWMPKFLDHQKINRPSLVSRNPPPPEKFSQNYPEFSDGSVSSGGGLSDGSVPKRKEKKENIKEKEKKQKKKSIETEWPKNFEMSEEMKKYAVENGIDILKTKLFFEDFHQWALAREAKYKNWEAAFRGRVLKAPEYGKQFMAEKTNGAGTATQKPTDDDMMCTAFDILINEGKPSFDKYCKSVKLPKKARDMVETRYNHTCQSNEKRAGKSVH